MLSFSFFRRQTRHRSRRAAALRRPSATTGAAAGLPPGPVETVPTCGWFDSSWELRQGLKVIEHMDFERLPPEVPLTWLLQ